MVQIGVGDRLLSTFRFGDRQAHIRLPRAKPHFADKHILQRYGLTCRRSRQLPRFPARLHGTESGQPLAVPVSRRRLLLACELERDLRIRNGPSPNGYGHLALQHAVVGEDLCESQIGCLTGDTRSDDENNKMYGVPRHVVQSRTCRV